MPSSRLGVFYQYLSAGTDAAPSADNANNLCWRALSPPTGVFQTLHEKIVVVARAKIQLGLRFYANLLMWQ